MALSSLRLRRALTSLSSLHRTISTIPAVSSPAHLLRSPSASAPATSKSLLPLLLQSQTFRSSSVALSTLRSPNKADGELGPDDILFEGCDYKHWLFVIDFPKDPKLTPEVMVAKYEEICAKGLNISIEEAKTKMYACSTTTYVGFQAVMSEEEAETFHKIPEVVFVLPDSYLYPETKEYGGDKYDNGQITPRPLPDQHQKKPSKPRNADTRSTYNQPRNPISNKPRNSGPAREGDIRGPMPNNRSSQDVNPHRETNNWHSQNHAPHGQMPNYRPSQDYVSHGQGDRRGPISNYQPPQDYHPAEHGGRVGPVPNYGASKHYGPPRPDDRRGISLNHGASQNYGPPQPDDRRGMTPNNEASQSYGPPRLDDRRVTTPYSGASQNYSQPRQGDERGPWSNHRVVENYGPAGQTEIRGPVLPYQGAYNQQQPGPYPQEQGGYPRREQRSYARPGQKDFNGDNRNYAPTHGGYPQREQRNYAYHGQKDFNGYNRNYAPTQEGCPQREQRSYAHPGQKDFNGENMNYPPTQGGYPQGEQSSYARPGQKDLSADNRNYAPTQGGNYGPGPSAHVQETGRSHAYQGYEDGQMFSQAENKAQGERMSSIPRGQTGTDQGRC